MDPTHPTGPSNPNPTSGRSGSQPGQGGAPAGNGSAPGIPPEVARHPNVFEARTTPPGAPFDPSDTQPVGQARGGQPPALTSAPVPAIPSPAPPPPAATGADAAPQTRAIFRDGQRLLYYSVNFSHFLVPDRVYAHGQIYESLLALTLIRLHAGLERLILAQMPMARGNTHPSAQGSGADWRDLTLYLQTRRTILRSDALFLNDTAQLRNQLVQGEIVALDREVVIRLAQLGEAIFLQLDPDYRRPELDAQKDALPPPARPAPVAAPPPPPPANAPAAPTAPFQPIVSPHSAAPTSQDASWLHPGLPSSQDAVPLHSSPPEAHRAAGAQRSHPADPTPLYCPNCGRVVEPGDLWCPRCGVNFVAPGALQPQPDPPGAGPAPRRSRGLFGRFMGR